MTKAQDDITSAERYLLDIYDGRIVSGKPMRMLAEKLMPRFTEPYKNFHWDRHKARRPVRFIERFCVYPTGKKMGKPFVLEPYEKAWVEIPFGFVDDDGLRQIREVLCEVARKCGKTSVLAGLQLFMLTADGEGAPQIYDNASNKDQSSLLYGATLKMIRMSDELSRKTHKGEVPDRAQDGIICNKNHGFITPLSSRTGNLDGLDTHFAPLDEMAAYVSGDSYDLLKQSTSAREQPMLYTISSQGFVRGGIFDSRLEYARGWLKGDVEDDTFLPFLYELDDPSEWLDRDCWIKTNPGLGTVKKTETLEDFVNQALQEPRFVATVKTKDFNIPQNKATAWLNIEDAVNEATFDVKSMGFRYGIVGIDAANTTDLNAAKMLLMRPELDNDGNRQYDERGDLIVDPHIYELSMYWIPSTRLPDDSRASRREKDDVPYTLWRDRGLLRVVEGNKVPRYVFLDWLEEIKRELDIYTFAIGYDEWGFQGSDGDNLESYVGKDRCEVVRQGAKTLSDPMKQMEADFKINRYVDNHNPINEWCRMNVMVVTDRNDNIAPVKKEQRAKHRIDGFMAEADAYVALLRHWDEYMSVI